MNNILKEAINNMQFYIDRTSQYVLLIFDNNYIKNDYVKKNKDKVNYEICITTTELCFDNVLVGRRFKTFYFMK